MIKGQFRQQDEEFTVQCSLKAGEKKLFSVNKLPVSRFSDHIGRIPIVLATPDDTVLIKEGSEERRRFFDGMLSQINHSYLEHLLRYNNFLAQRSSLLKQYQETRRIDTHLLDTYDSHLCIHATFLFEARTEFAAQFTPLFSEWYRQLSGGSENVGLEYLSQLQGESIEYLLKQGRGADLASGRSLSGVHRDDFIFSSGGHPLKKFGSQGQQKCYVIALRLAQFKAMQDAGTGTPLLLLDDIFDKLDDARINALLTILHSPDFGQVFITDARPERSLSLLQGSGEGVKFFKVKNGEIDEL